MTKFYTEIETISYKPFFSKKSVIDLVEIALLDESAQNVYWAVCKEFNLRKAWTHNNGKFRRVTLLPIHKKLAELAAEKGTYLPESYEKFSKSSLKNLLNWFGKSRQELKDDINNYFDNLITSAPFLINIFYGAYDRVALYELLWEENAIGLELPYFLHYIKDLDSELDMLTNYDDSVRNKLFTSHPTFPKSPSVGESTALEGVYWLRNVDNFLEKYKIKND